MKLRHKTKRIFAAALAVWLSGIVVLFCCGSMPVQAAGAEIESCPLAKKGKCAKTIETASTVSLKQSPPTFDCCAFPAKIFDKSKKLEKSSESTRPAQTIQIAEPRFFIVERVFKSPKFHHSYVRDYSGTHLRNCVFKN